MFGTTFSRWEHPSVENIKYDVAKISWEEIGFVVSLVSDDQHGNQPRVRMQLIWDPSQVISHHVTDETYRPDCWGLDFQKEGRFFETRQSDYIEQFKKLSPLIPDDVIHFTLVGTNTIVDLLVKDYPLVKKS